MKKAKWYGSILIIFLLLILICTYISNQIYLKNLPIVTVENGIRTVLRYTHTADGIFSYTKKIDITAFGDCFVTKAYAKQDDFIELGDPLVKVDLEDLKLAMFQLQVEQDGLDRSYEQATLSYAKELVQHKRENVYKKIEELQTILDAEGVIYAPISGCVVVCAKEEESIKQGQNIAVLGDLSGGKSVQFSLDASSKYMTGGTNITVSFTAEKKQQAIELPLSNFEYCQRNNSYSCMALMPEDMKLVEGQNISVTVKVSSDEFPHVIPTNALTKTDTGNVIFYVLSQKETSRGTEYYAMEWSAVVLEENETYTAINAPIREPVIATTSKPLYNGCIVRVKDV